MSTLKDKHFYLEAILSFSLFCAAICLFRGILPGYKMYLVFILCGFFFSFFEGVRQARLVKSVVNIAVCGAIIWIVYSIANSSLLYKEAALLCVRGAVIIGVFISFGAYDYRTYPETNRREGGAFLQTDARSEDAGVVSAPRQGRATPQQEAKMPPLTTRGFGIGSKPLTYLRVLSLSLFMCFSLFVKAYNEDLIVLISAYLVFWLVILRVEFYKAADRPPGRINPKQHYAIILLAIFFMLALSLSAIFFAKIPLRKIIKGGIFLAEDPGNTDAGEDREGKSYYDLRIELVKKITGLISEAGFVEDKYAILSLLSYLIKDSSTIMEVDKAETGLIDFFKTPGPGLEKGEGEETTLILKSYTDKKIAVNLGNIEESVKNNLRNPFKAREKNGILHFLNKIKNSGFLAQAEEYERQLKESINNSSLADHLKKKLERLAEQFREWKAFEIRRHKGTLLANKMPQDLAPVFLKKEELKTYPKAKKPFVVKFDIPAIEAYLLKITAGCAVVLLPFAFIWFAVLYFLGLRQRNRLVFSYFNNPREFVISLYENTKKIIAISGLRYEGFLPPLQYAGLVERRYEIKDNLFLRLTEKFAEAKYSRHILSAKDISPVLGDYNNFLNILFSRENRFSLIFKCGLALLHNRPLFLRLRTPKLQFPA